MEVETVSNKKLKRQKLTRGTTSLLILLFVIPFIAIAGILTAAGWIEGYRYFFMAVLDIGLIYGAFEITNFIFPRRDNKQKWWTIFLLAAMFMTLAFIWFSVGIIRSYSGVTGGSGAYIINRTIGLGYVSLILFLFIIALAFILFLYRESYKNWFYFMLVIVLFTLFMISLLYITVVWGWEISFFFIIAVALTDTFAYLGGKKWGKTKAFPTISPNKTTEGLVVGYGVGITFGIMWALILVLGTNYNNITPVGQIGAAWLVLVGVGVVLIAPMGDLLFSKIKREYNKKDFGNLLPGHGGLLDRVDSHIVAFTTGTILLLIFQMR